MMTMMTNAFNRISYDKPGRLARLHAACVAGHLECVERMLDNNRFISLGSIDARDIDCALRLAASVPGNIQIVQKLLHHYCGGPEVFSKSFGADALRVACYIGHTNIVNFLLRDGRIHPSFYFHHEIIYMAAEKGHTEIVRMLLDNYRTDTSDGSHIALHAAIDFRRDDTARMLLQRKELNLWRCGCNQFWQCDRPLCFSELRLIAGRVTEVCSALQPLRLPALQMLMIIDELIPNDIRMWAIWQAVVKIKHFRQSTIAVE